MENVCFTPESIVLQAGWFSPLEARWRGAGGQEWLGGGGQGEPDARWPFGVKVQRLEWEGASTLTHSAYSGLSSERDHGSILPHFSLNFHIFSMKKKITYREVSRLGQ